MFCLDCGNVLRSINQLLKQAKKNVKLETEMTLNEPVIEYEIELIDTTDDNDLYTSNSQQQMDESLSEFLILGNQKEDIEVNNNDTQDLSNAQSENKTAITKTKSKEKRKPLMCSFCCK